MKTIDLTPGGLASVPITGLCRVVEMQEQEMLGEMHRFFVLASEDNDYVVKIPASQIEKMGIRPLLDSEEMEGLLEDPPEIESPKERTPLLIKKWTRELRSGKPGARRQVLLELNALRLARGKLGKREGAFLETVRTNFRHEIEEVLELSPSQAGYRLNRAIGMH
ncbi:MAG: hypothetical protein AB7S38_33155 [Vulcanimicrobiota bacterium]